jgi:hypothetical protein
MSCEAVTVRRSIATASCVLTGALAGAMTLIRFVLVPFWQQSPPPEFKSWFSANAPRLRALMVPLGAAAAATTTANALVNPRAGTVLGATAAAGVVAVTVAVNEPLNERFTGPAPVEPADLARWTRWHEVRIALGLVAVWATARR